MIDFRIDFKSKKYLVNWTEDELFEQLFLFIKPVKPVKIVYDEKLELDSDVRKYTKSLPIYKSMSSAFIELPRMPSTTYAFELYDDQKAKGDPIEKRVGYLGSTEVMYIEQQHFSNDVIRMSVKCKYQISKELFWLSFSRPHVNMRIYLPPMKKECNQFEASCFMLAEAYTELVLCLDDKINDCIQVLKR